MKVLENVPPPNVPADVVARRKIFQGRSLCRLGKWAESEAALVEAERLTGPAERYLQAELAFARSKCSSSTDRALARRYSRQSAELARGVDSFVEARGLLEEGYLWLKDRKYESDHQAITSFTKALPITDSDLLREPLLGNLAVAYAELGDWRQSVAFAEQAEKLAGQMKNLGDQEAWLIDLGRGYFEMRQYSDAEPYYSRAYTIARGLNDTDAIWRCLNNLTELALRRHDLNTAMQRWNEESALKLGDEGRAHVTFDEAKISMERKDFSTAEHLFNLVLQSSPKDSFRLTTERELGEVYWQEKKLIDADRTFREAIDHAEEIIKRIPPQYRMAFLDVDPFYDSYVRFLAAQLKPLEALRIAEHGRAQILSQALWDTQNAQSSFSLPTVQAALKKRNQIALAYSLTDEESFVWVIKPTQFTLLRSLPSHKELRPLIDAYKNETVGPARSIEESSACQELYKKLIQRAEIPKDSRVVIIPSKILSLVNFEALVVPGPQPHYWIDDVEIETASSLALLARQRPTSTKATKSKKNLFLMGAPLEADKAFPALQNAADEMARVRSHFPAYQETVLSGKDAIPQSYRKNNPGDYRFIHIDAHSVASELNPMDSFVVLSPSGDSYKLYARDITGTPLHADLVTLSACYGAGTRWYNGEGIVGLGWAFLRAGAHQVVASLWTVDDASTPQLMDDFYGELSKGKSAAEALRTAKLKMLHPSSQRSRPYYWASLQLYTGS